MTPEAPEPTPTYDALALDFFRAELDVFHTVGDLGWT